jgi:uncharacterized protein
MDDELAALCQACGLCCDGTLFGRVGLEADEIEPARRNRLHVIESGTSFEQPCAALSVGERRLCSAYETRPRACARFVCRLYERHRTEGGSLEPRLSAVRRVRELMTELHGKGVLPGDRLAELTKRIDDDFARA